MTTRELRGNGVTCQSFNSTKTFNCHSTVHLRLELAKKHTVEGKRRGQQVESNIGTGRGATFESNS